ncbi:MAG: SDR family NAD(P)-dependent oxidoreductase [Bacteroidota bacterium]
MKNLNGKVAVITGAGAGMGKELALQLAAKGVKVAINDWNGDNLQQTVATIKKNGGTVLAKRFDVSSREAVYAFKDEVLRQFGQVDIVINNAGIALPSYNIEDVPYDEFEKLININLWGVIYGTKAYLPHLQTRPEAVVANTSSVFGIMGFPTQGAYCAAKFAVKGFTETLRLELAAQESNVRALSIHPGRIFTDIVRNVEHKPGLVTEEEKAAMVKQFDEGGKGVTAADAAKQIIQAIQKGKPRLLIGSDASFIDKIVRLLPTRYAGIILKRLNAEPNSAVANPIKPLVEKVTEEVA